MAKLMRWFARGNWYFNRGRGTRGSYRYALTLIGQCIQPLIARFLMRSCSAPALPTITINSTQFPPQICDQQSLASVHDVVLSDRDIVVASPMRSGTTWLQRLVLLLISDDLDQLEKPLLSLSPFLESFQGVCFEKAPTFGGFRVSKTHLLPTQLKSITPATVLYIHRDQVDSFNSFCHFIRLQAGPFCPDRQQLYEFYHSEQMYFGHIDRHISAWQTAATANARILCLRYNDLARDSGFYIRLIASHIGVAVSEEKLKNVLALSTHDYMAKNADLFEVALPALFSVNGNLFPSLARVKTKERILSPLETVGE